jgi:hypothetical protein
MDKIEESFINSEEKDVRTSSMAQWKNLCKEGKISTERIINLCNVLFGQHKDDTGDNESTGDSESNGDEEEDVSEEESREGSESFDEDLAEAQITNADESSDASSDDSSSASETTELPNTMSLLQMLVESEDESALLPPSKMRAQLRNETSKLVKQQQAKKMRILQLLETWIIAVLKFTQSMLTEEIAVLFNQDLPITLLDYALSDADAEIRKRILKLLCAEWKKLKVVAQTPAPAEDEDDQISQLIGRIEKMRSLSNDELIEIGKILRRLLNSEEKQKIVESFLLNESFKHSNGFVLIKEISISEKEWSKIFQKISKKDEISYFRLKQCLLSPGMIQWKSMDYETIQKSVSGILKRLAKKVGDNSASKDEKELIKELLKVLVNRHPPKQPGILSEKISRVIQGFESTHGQLVKNLIALDSEKEKKSVAEKKRKSEVVEEVVNEVASEKVPKKKKKVAHPQ